jgi:hypothetical protein
MFPQRFGLFPFRPNHFFDEVGLLALLGRAVFQQQGAGQARFALRHGVSFPVRYTINIDSFREMILEDLQDRLETTRIFSPQRTFPGGRSGIFEPGSPDFRPI